MNLKNLFITFFLLIALTASAQAQKGSFGFVDDDVFGIDVRPSGAYFLVDNFVDFSDSAFLCAIGMVGILTPGSE